jgi:PAS domain-containing protein
MLLDSHAVSFCATKGAPVLSEPVAMTVDTAGLAPPSAMGNTILSAVQALSAELGSVRDEVGPEASARLAGAEDELAAIRDEMRQQQQEIGELLAGVGSGRVGMMRRFLATLPLATLLTSATGKILEANGAAHAALRLPMGGLAGKPIFAYIAQDDRRRLRSALSQALTDSDLLQTAALVTPRHGTAVPSHFALVREIDEPVVPAVPVANGEIKSVDGGSPEEAEIDPGTVRWVILPDYEAVDGPPSHRQLEALTRLCRLGAEDGDLRSTLTQAAKLCVQAIAEADDVTLLVGNPLEPSMMIATSATAQHLDGLQHVRAGGPSFDAFRSRRPVALDGDAVRDHPALADDTRARSIRSLLAIPLVTDDLPSGVLTVYGTGERSVATLVALRQVMPFVEAAQTLIRDTRAHEEMRRTQEQLEAALTSRAVIDQAKGMIMISLKCTADDAFGHLVRMSSTRHEKVREVAQSMVDDIFTKRSRPPGNPSE